MAKKVVPVRYTSRDFASIKQDLVNYAKKYYPDTYKDFNEASFGSLMLDTVAYVGDIMSYYLDYQANESILDTAIEYDNIVRLANSVGYKEKGVATATGVVAIYFQIPSNGNAPDMNYLPVIKRGSTFSTQDNKIFTLVEDINISTANSQIIQGVENENGPLSFIVKTYGRVISGVSKTINVTIGDFVKFRKLELDQSDVTEIISVLDSNGNEYYEVEYLTQNVIYKSLPNIGEDKEQTPFILKPTSVLRRFTTNRVGRSMFLQFGAASENILDDSSQRVADPSEIVLDLYGKEYNTDEFFDPTRLLNSDKLGLGPENTTLTITYRYNTDILSNAPSFTVNGIGNLLLEFKQELGLASTTKAAVQSSFEVTNEEPIIGQTNDFSTDELKTKIYGTYAAQARAVTEQDYQSLAYLMPSKFGKVKRVKVVRDTDELKRNLNLYVISQDNTNNLITSSLILKKNLKTWLEKNKIINDTIDILDAKIVNYKIEFVILADLNVSKYEVLANCLDRLKRDLATKSEIGEPLMISNIYSSLKKVDGVVDVRDVKILNAIGSLYSNFSFDFNKRLSPDGRFIGVPKNVIMELKYPDADIRGSVI
jgi:hypothetical protein